MPSSSQHNTGLELQIERLFMETLVHCISAKHDYDVINTIVELGLDLLDRDIEWWAMISNTTVSDAARLDKDIMSRRALFQEISTVDYLRRPSQILNDLSWSLAKIGHLLAYQDRHEEAEVWLGLGYDCLCDKFDKEAEEDMVITKQLHKLRMMDGKHEKGG